MNVRPAQKARDAYERAGRRIDGIVESAVHGAQRESRDDRGKQPEYGSRQAPSE